MVSEIRRDTVLRFQHVAAKERIVIVNYFRKLFKLLGI